MRDQIWKEFFADNQTQRAFEASEVWTSFAESELQRDQLRLKTATIEKIEEENAIMDQIDTMNRKVASNPLLKAKLKAARNHLELHPELVKHVDPNFIKGLELLDLGE